MKDVLTRLVEGRSLTIEEAERAMDAVFNGQATPAQIAAFLVALRMKGETVEEITGFARAMRKAGTKISPKVAGRIVDTCGTGGAAVKTFNVSTVAAFVLAGGGVPVVKHGNRSVTGSCGSADVLEALGVDLALAPARVEAVVETVGFGFCFAPGFHPAMKHAAPVRKEMGIRTVFNVLGPLTNPAGATGQVVGVFDPRLVDLLPPVLANLGVLRAVVAHGEGGLDEISTVGPTTLGVLDAGRVRTETVRPQDFGIAPARPADVGPLAPKESAVLLREVLSGVPGPRRDIVLLNAAAGFFVAGRCDSLKAGLVLAEGSIDSGRAEGRLDAYLSAASKV
ncbi:MAG: anthranilate phosphoribosyltransferase [Methanobacteriota archaeon]